MRLTCRWRRTEGRFRCYSDYEAGARDRNGGSEEGEGAPGHNERDGRLNTGQPDSAAGEELSILLPHLHLPLSVKIGRAWGLDLR